jgi:hypothetical protein
MASEMKHAEGERLNIRFNKKVKLEFHGARLTSDAGLLAYRDQYDCQGRGRSSILQ